MFKQYRQFEEGEEVLVGVDTAYGGEDYTAAQFLSRTKLDVPLVYHSKITTSAFTPQCHLRLEEIFDKTKIPPLVAYERNNGGVFEMDRLAALNRGGKYRIFKMSTYGKEENALTPKLGWDTNSATRPQMLSDLKDAIDRQALKIYNRDTINEMFGFVIVKTTASWKAQAEEGSHDDLIFALAVAYQLYQLSPAMKKPENIKLIQLQNIKKRKKWTLA